MNVAIRWLSIAVYLMCATTHSVCLVMVVTQCALSWLQEEVVTITMNKYRKAQSMVEEADHRADMAEKSVAISRTRGRSMSLNRNVVRVVHIQ